MDKETTAPESSAIAIAADFAKSSWTVKYGSKFHLQWIRNFPQGIIPPRRVRIYRRNDHYLARWWDPAARKNLSARIDGDLVAAIARAREIEERLTNFRSAGSGCRRVEHGNLIDQFFADLEKRANADTIDPKTVHRYAAALEHYRAFCDQPAICKAFPHIAGINREFRLAFSAFLASRRVAGNGAAGANRRPMKSQSFVLDTVRAMLEWAADPERGHLLSDGFRNPFLRHGEQRPIFKGDPLSEPDITTSMAIDLVRACDRYQLLLFAPMLLFGLRSHAS